MLKTSNNIIEESFYCHDISLSLGGRIILNDVKLKVNPGQILGLVGPNGAGKTSLFEVLCGRYKPSKGSIVFNGLDISKLSFLDRSKKAKFILNLFNL